MQFHLLGHPTPLNLASEEKSIVQCINPHMTLEDIYPREWTKILKETYDKRVHKMDILIHKPDKHTIKLINIKSRYLCQDPTRRVRTKGWD